MSNENNEDEKPKVVGKTIRLAGDVDNCGHCKEGDSFFKENAPKADAKYEYYHIESDKGKEIADNLDAGPKGSVPIPAIEYCKTIQEGDNKEEKCDYVEGFSKNDWDDKLNYKRPNDVDEEIDELFGED
jgi:hypothetical protein